MKIEDILKKLENMYSWEGIEPFILSLHLTPDQFEVLSNHKRWIVKWAIAKHPYLPEDLVYKLSKDKKQDVRCAIAYRSDLPEDLLYKMSEDNYLGVRENISDYPDLSIDLYIRLSCDSFEWASRNGFGKLKKLNSLKLEDLQTAYDLIMDSKYIGKKEVEKTFNYIVNKFPKLREHTKMFKKLILKLKKDLK